MMGMGEPLANYRNVMAAIHRMNDELGIGARKITVSTVGVVPSIRKLAEEDLQVRLAISLHCASEEERSALLPANKRYGGIDELLTAVREYIEKTRRRVTFEWALIEGQNDGSAVARRLGRLLRRHGIRRDMAHVNIIPLNPTGGFEGGPSGRKSVENFVKVLDSEFGISATPRMRRGIDIDAGCGQLKAAIKKRERKDAIPTSETAGDALTTGASKTTVKKMEKEDAILTRPTADDALTTRTSAPTISALEIEDDLPEEVDGVYNVAAENKALVDKELALVEFMIQEDAINLDESEDEVIDEVDPEEANRLIALVQSSFLKPVSAQEADQQNKGSATQVPTSTADTNPSTGTSEGRIQVETRTKITDEDDVRKASRKRKKLLKNLKAIAKLKDMQSNGKILNDEQKAKVAKEEEWTAQIDNIEHNLR